MFIATLSLIIQTGKKSRYLDRQIIDKTVAHPHKGIIPLLTQTNRPKSLWKDLEESCIQRGKQKKPIWKGNMLCDSKSMASFWDRSKDANRKGINSSYVVEGKGGINRTLSIFKAMKLFHGILYLWVKLLKLIEWTIPRVNLNVNHGLKVIMMCQCRFIDFNKLHFHKGYWWGTVVCMWGNEVYWKSLYLSLNFAEPKTPLKKSILIEAVYIIWNFGLFKTRHMLGPLIVLLFYNYS